MIRYIKFNRVKWDWEVKLWMEVIGDDERTHYSFISPRDRQFNHYWDIIIECNDYEYIESELIKIKGDYLFPDYLRFVKGNFPDPPKFYNWYSISDYYEYCKVRGQDFPDKWLWCIRDCKIDLLYEGSLL
jgi:hypothetical protein